MTTIPPRVLEIAENLNMNVPRRPGEECVIDPRYAAVIGAEPDPHQDVVQRLRLEPSEVAATVAEVRALYAARGRHQITWEVSSSATPSDLGERLMALGIVPDAPEPLAVGMVLARPLEHAAGAFTVKKVTTFDEYRIASNIFLRGFGGPEAESDPEALFRRFERARASDVGARYLAYLDGEPVAAAEALYLDAAVVMCGGATLASARGKGAYRALIAARWEEGRRRGTPMLVTQAGAMSRPILRRLGFEEVAEIRIFLDVFG
jgi:hypothetical protein